MASRISSTVGPGARFAGAVLAGGASRRMGIDKAFIEIDGVPMVARVAGALTEAGAAPVVVVGGEGSRMKAIGIEALADPHPGEGPLQAVMTALDRMVDADLVVVLACDLVAPDPATIAEVVAALVAAPKAAMAAPVVDRQVQWLHAAWRPAVATGLLASAWQRGVRSLRDSLDPQAVVEVEGLQPWALADADRPDDLAAGPTTVEREGRTG